MLVLRKIVFSEMKFRVKFEVARQKQFLSMAANNSKSEFCTVY